MQSASLAGIRATTPTPQQRRARYATALPPVHPRWRRRAAAPLPRASGADDPSPAAEDSQPPLPTAYASGSTAVAIPAGLRTAGAVFVLAGFLKILIVCFPYSTMAISMYMQGRADLGAWAALKMIPLALGTLALAKTLLDRKINERRWFHRAVVVGGIAALALSRWAFCRPRPSPLDPVLAAHARQTGATAAAQRRAALEVEARRQGGLGQPGEQARREVEARRGEGSRFGARR